VCTNDLNRLSRRDLSLIVNQYGVVIGHNERVNTTANVTY